MQVGHLLPDHCNEGRHNWKPVFTVGGDLAERIVRWCQDCGCLRIDVDFDGHCQRGEILPIQAPQILYRKLE